jgi:hypothetical protein
VPPPSAANEHLFWQTIRDSKNPADFKAYLARWPNGTFAELAKIRIADLEKPVVVTPPPAPERTVPPAPPPGPPRRVSTWEPNVLMSGSAFATWSGTEVDARRCQATCVQNPKCAAWWWATVQCAHYSRLDNRSPNSGSISGVIRMVAATPAQPGAAPPQPAPPQTPRRTSSWEQGVMMWGSAKQYFHTMITPTPQQCMAACVREQRCRFWYHRGPQGLTVNECIMFDNLERRDAGKYQGYTAGEIRTAPGR